MPPALVGLDDVGIVAHVGTSWLGSGQPPGR